MSKANPVILLLEASDVCAFRIILGLVHALPACRVVHARSVSDAWMLCAGARIDLCIANLDSASAELAAFARDFQSSDQAPTMIGLVTPGDLTGHAMAAAAGIHAIIDNPAQIDELASLLRIALATSGDADAHSDPEGFEATLRSVTPIDVIQMTCLRGSTSVLEFVSPAGVGLVRVIDGDIVHAATGELTGVEALNEIVSWKKGRVTESQNACIVVPTIHGDWQMLLMHAAHSIDQAQVAC